MYYDGEIQAQVNEDHVVSRVFKGPGTFATPDTPCGHTNLKVELGVQHPQHQGHVSLCTQRSTALITSSWRTAVQHQEPPGCEGALVVQDRGGTGSLAAPPGSCPPCAALPGHSSSSFLLFHFFPLSTLDYRDAPARPRCVTR